MVHQKQGQIGGRTGCRERHRPDAEILDAPRPSA
jgi:hypothetical protein